MIVRSHRFNPAVAVATNLPASVLLFNRGHPKIVEAAMHHVRLALDACHSDKVRKAVDKQADSLVKTVKP